MDRVKRLYGGGPLHLLCMMFCFALWLYVIVVAGPATLVNPQVWWQSIAVWFIAGAILHDLLLFPLYALADLSLRSGLRAMQGLPIRTPAAVPIVNYVRVPVLGTGLSFLLFFPGLIRQGEVFYHNATGLTQDPFLHRWLLLVATMFGTSAAAYAVRLSWHSGRRTHPLVDRAVRPAPNPTPPDCAAGIADD
jgi:hypothetical protein